MIVGSLLRRVFRRAPTDAAPVAAADAAPEQPKADLKRLLAAAGACEKRRAWTDAAGLLEQLCDLVPDDPQAHLRLARALSETGREQDAIDSYRLALHYDPACIEASLGVSNLLLRGGLRDAAIDALQDAIPNHPGSAKLHAELGLRLTEAERVDAALAALNTAVVLDSAYAPGWHNRGYLRLQLGEAEAALDDFRTAMKLAPGQRESRAGVAHALRDLGRFDLAVERYRKIIARHPGFEDAINNLALTQLLLGRFDEGFRNYEWRFGPLEKVPRAFPFPVWRGQPLAGKRILLYAEQGIGDEIMFASCLPQVLEQAGDCTIECSDRVAGLFARSFPGAQVHGGRKSDSLDWLQASAPADYQSPIGSLPRYLRRNPAAFVQHTGYLQADADRVRHWRARLAQLPGRLRVGISWRGGTLASRGRSRSIPWCSMAPLIALPDVAFVSLQHGAVIQEFADAPANARPHVFDGVGDNIEDLAALIRALDLVISVDNTNVHIAGAVGASVWVLLAHVPDWRYGIAGSAMAWYPSATLYRQSRAGGWDEVVGEVARQLAQRTAACTGGGG